MTTKKHRKTASSPFMLASFAANDNGPGGLTTRKTTEPAPFKPKKPKLVHVIDARSGIFKEYLAPGIPANEE